MENKLTILWTSGDPITAEFMVFMYAENSLIRDWWEEVEIIVWGASTKLLVEDKSIQKRLLELKEKGVEVRFCRSCAAKLDLVSQLESLGFNLESMGPPLTEILKRKGHLLTI